MLVHYKDLNPSYFRFEGGALKRFFLFNVDTIFYFINPETIASLGGGPITALTESQMNSNLRSNSSEHLIFGTASDYLATNWSAKGWEIDDPAFISELGQWVGDTFSSGDINPGALPNNMYIVQGNIGGLDYIAPIVYFGDRGNISYVNGGPASAGEDVFFIDGGTFGDFTLRAIEEDFDTDLGVMQNIGGSDPVNIINGRAVTQRGALAGTVRSDGSPFRSSETETGTQQATPELAINGDFSLGNLSGWTTASGAISIQGFAARVDGNGTEGLLTQTYNSTPNKKYLIQFDLVGEGASPLPKLLVNDGQSAPTLGALADLKLNANQGLTTYKYVYVPSASYFTIGLANGSSVAGDFADFDNVSVKEVTEEFSSELIANGTFDTDVLGWTEGPNATLEYSAGVALLRTNDGNGTGCFFSQEVATVVGQAYTISFDTTITISGRESTLRVFDSPAKTNQIGSAVSPTSAATHNVTTTFIATTSATTLEFSWNALGINNFNEFDNITIKQLQAQEIYYGYRVYGGNPYFVEFEDSGLNVVPGIAVVPHSTTSTSVSNINGTSFLVTFGSPVDFNFEVYEINEDPIVVDAITTIPGLDYEIKSIFCKIFGNQVINSEFKTDLTNWVDASTGGSTAEHSANSEGSLLLTNSGVNGENPAVTQELLLVEGRSYFVEVTIAGGTYTDSLEIRLEGATTDTQTFPVSSPGNYSFTYTADQSSTILRVTTGSSLISGTTFVSVVKVTDLTSGIEVTAKEGQPLNRSQWDAAPTIATQNYTECNGQADIIFTATTTVATIGWSLTGEYAKFGVNSFYVEYQVTSIVTDELYGIDGGDFDLARPPSNLEYTTPITFFLGNPVSILPNRVDGLDLTFSAINLPTGISIDSETGEIFGTPTQTSSVTTTVTATNELGSTDFDIEITTQASSAPSNLTYGTPQLFTLQQEITPFSPLSVTGIVESYSAPSLPAGLSINSTTGEISGIPTVLLTATDIEIIASNGIGSTSFNVNMEILNEAPANLTYDTPQSFTLTQPITPFSPLTIDGTNIIYSASGLPSGLSINSSTGEISGTPDALFATQAITVTATNDQGNTTFDIAMTVINLAPSGLSYDTPQTYEIDVAITPLSPTVTGTNLTYSASVLPSGITLNSSTGEISGTPDEFFATQAVTINANNDQGIATFDITITVESNEELLTGSLDTGTGWTASGDITATFEPVYGASFTNNTTAPLSGAIRQTVGSIENTKEYQLLVEPNYYLSSPSGAITVYESDGITPITSVVAGPEFVQQAVDFVATDTTVVIEFSADNIAGGTTGSDLWGFGNISDTEQSISTLTPGTTYILEATANNAKFTLGNVSSGTQYLNFNDSDIVNGSVAESFTATTNSNLFAVAQEGSLTGVTVKEFSQANISYRDASLKRV